jgi:hypothetical protein
MENGELRIKICVICVPNYFFGKMSEVSICQKWQEKGGACVLFVLSFTLFADFYRFYLLRPGFYFVILWASLPADGMTAGGEGGAGEGFSKKFLFQLMVIPYSELPSFLYITFLKKALPAPPGQSGSGNKLPPKLPPSSPRSPPFSPHPPGIPFAKKRGNTLTQSE